MQVSELLRKLHGFFFAKKKRETEGRDAAASGTSFIEPREHFKSLKVISKTPANDSIGEGEFIAVVYQNEPYWAIFRCPCGCGTVISLSLQKVHKPSWTVQASAAGRPTLNPSVWQNTGCCSHFWIKDGRVHWCSNSGMEPWVAEPRYYTKPR